jgi:hypothetical protein
MTIDINNSDDMSLTTVYKCNFKYVFGMVFIFKSTKLFLR